MVISQPKNIFGVLGGDFQVLQALPVSAVISDARISGSPIIYVNPAFEGLTGYLSGDVLGRNCNFLQKPGENLTENNKIRNCITNLTASKSVLKNYRKDGSYFINEVSINPIYSHDGEITHFIGTQNIVANIAAEFDKEQITARFKALTPREKDVFHAISCGGSNKSIARDLNISPRTVEKHRANLNLKMDIRNAAQLVRQALLMDLI